MGRFECWARQSGRLRLVPGVFLAGVSLLVCGCGGGQADVQPQPPPSPDFALVFSASTVTVSQGSTSSAVTVSVTPLNEFSGQVQVSLSSLPAGVAANPSSPFTISAGANVSLLFSASSSATTGTVSLTATGTSSNLTHTAPLGLTVQVNTSKAVPRSNYIRTNSIAALDTPAGEPHHRHMVLDAAHQHLFVANRAKNVVEIISSQDGSRTAEISAPGATSADISADEKTV